MGWLSVEPWGVLGLVLAQLWAESGSGVGGCRAGVPESSVILLVGVASS